MGSAEELELLQKQLAGLAKAVEDDQNLPANMEDYLVTLNSLKTRIATAKQPEEPDDPRVGGTMTGRMSSKNPNLHTLPRTAIEEASDQTVKAMNPHTHPPVTDRRAAILHTRKLNELNNGS